MNKDNDVISFTLNNTIQRIAKIVNNYEIEIANLTMELVKTQLELDSLKSQDVSKTKS
jgi:hypothetical protein